MSNAMKSIKQQKEDFVSGLTGGSVSEIYICTIIAISSYAIWAILQSKLSLFNYISRSPNGVKVTVQKPFLSPATFLDFGLNWLSTLLSVTLYANDPLILNASILVPALIVLVTAPKTPQSLLEEDGNKNTLSKDKNNDTDLKQKDNELKPITELSILKTYLPRHSFLSVYRGQMMIITCLAILAVDFRIFPRRFAKVETWGTSLMDLGVGSFVFSMGLVSARRTLVRTFFANSEKSPISATSQKLLPELFLAFQQSFSILGLGLIRLALVKYLNYQEHVTEYGVHWNFFMTLGLLPPVVATLDYLFEPKITNLGKSEEGKKSSKKNSSTTKKAKKLGLKSLIPKISIPAVPTSIVALIISIIYEFVLNKMGLIAYIITAPRVDLISKNREGIFSFIGYLSIFLFGKATGYFMLPSAISFKSMFYPQTEKEYLEIKRAIYTGKPESVTLKSNYFVRIFKTRKNKPTLKRVAILILVTVISNALYYFCRSSLRLRVSRRFANLPYVLWVVSYNTLNLALFAMMELAIFQVPAEYPYDSIVPLSDEAVNDNGLVVFLLANILTGLVNMSFNTLTSTRTESILILSGYAFVLFTISTLMKRKGIFIRF